MGLTCNLIIAQALTVQGLTTIQHEAITTHIQAIGDTHVHIRAIEDIETLNKNAPAWRVLGPNNIYTGWYLRRRMEFVIIY